MSCETHREELALRLYGELEPAEARALEAHLESCDACRAFADELERGLGRLAGAAPPEAPVPAGPWSTPAAEIVGAARPRWGRAPAWSLAAAGFAAGFLAAWLGLATPADPGAGTGPAAPAGASVELAAGVDPAGGFGRASAPPPAAGPGSLGRVGHLLAR